MMSVMGMETGVDLTVTSGRRIKLYGSRCGSDKGKRCGGSSHHVVLHDSQFLAWATGLFRREFIYVCLFSGTGVQTHNFVLVKQALTPLS